MATRKKKNNIGAFGHPIYGKGFAKYGEMQPNGSSEISNDLEEAANHYASVTNQEAHGNDFIREVFIARAEWQKDKDTRDMYMSDNRHFNKVYELGKKDMKQQMMKEAAEGEVVLNPYPTICLDDCKDYDFKDGDKVRIIIVKE